MTRLFGIGMIIVALGCTEPNPLATTDTSSGTTDAATTSMSTTIDPTTTTTTVSTSTEPTTTDPTTTDPTTETTDPTTGPGDTSTGEAACDEASHRCVPEPPKGWSLPSAVRYSDADAEDPGCVEPYTMAGAVAFADLVPGPHECDCACGDPVNVSCSNVTLTGDNSMGCGSPFDDVVVGEGCTAMPAALQIPGTSYWRGTAAVDGGTCDEQATVEIGPAAFEDRLTVCRATTVGSGVCADGETCTPLPGAEHDGRICIWQDGDVPCPDRVWSDRTLLHEDFDDERGCTVCTCGDVEGVCEGFVVIGTTANCVGGQAVANIAVDGACHQGASAQTAAGGSINGTLAAVDPLCLPSDSSEVGTISATGPVTLCCLPPE